MTPPYKGIVVNYTFPFLTRFSMCPDFTTGTLGSLTSQLGASVSSFLMIFPPFISIFRTREKIIRKTVRKNLLSIV